MAEPKSAWAYNDRVASYMWELLLAGDVVYAVEYPPIGPETRFADIGFVYRERMGRQPGDIHTYVNATDHTLTLRAHPCKNPAIMPIVEIEIAPGDAMVWTHRCVQTLDMVQSSGAVVQPYETQLIGCETLLGHIDLAQIWPNGEIVRFATYHDAMAIL